MKEKIKETINYQRGRSNFYDIANKAGELNMGEAMEITGFKDKKHKRLFLRRLDRQLPICVDMSQYKMSGYFRIPHIKPDFSICYGDPHITIIKRTA